MSTATKVKEVTGWTGTAALYHVDPPLEGNDYVIVSAADVPFSGPETYIFPATESGEVTDWGELDGSFRGGLDHQAALSGAGYEVSE